MTSNESALMLLLVSSSPPERHDDGDNETNERGVEGAQMEEEQE